MSENENKNKPIIKVVKLGPWFFPILAISVILLINFFNGGFDMNYPKSTSISSFYDLLSKNQIEKVDILTSTSGNTAEVTLKKAAYVASKDEELKTHKNQINKLEDFVPDMKRVNLNVNPQEKFNFKFKIQ